MRHQVGFPLYRTYRGYLYLLPPHLPDLSFWELLRTISLPYARVMMIFNTVTGRAVKATALCLGLSIAIHAATVDLTLDGNFATPDYAFYSFTDTAGVAQDPIPVGPYITYLNGDGYNDAPAYTICYDINSPTAVGTSYPGQLEVLTDAATMEATYLVNQLNLAGGINAPLATRGAISLAIWQIMYPSSTTNGTAFPSDPAAQPYETAAATAVSNGSWTTADSAVYPTWVPNDPSVQRFGVILPGVTSITTVESGTPEPASLGLMGLGILGMAVLGTRQEIRRRSPRALNHAASGGDASR